MKIVRLEGKDADYFVRVLQNMTELYKSGDHFRFAIDSDGVKVKMGEDIWSPGYGEVQPRT